MADQEFTILRFVDASSKPDLFLVEGSCAQIAKDLGDAASRATNSGFVPAEVKAVTNWVGSTE